MSAPIVFLDTETTGVHPGRKVWEVAMIRRDERGQQETSFMVQVDLAAADPFGLNVGRFYDRHPFGRLLAGGYYGANEVVNGESYPSPAQAAEIVAVWTHGAHIVGAVPNFDTEVLGLLLCEHGLIPAWHYHLIDVENLAVGYLSSSIQLGAAMNDRTVEEERLAVAPPWDSEELSRLCGVEPANEEERHTALGDARWAMRLYDAVTGGAS